MNYRKKPVVVDAVQLTQEAVIAHVLDKMPLPAGCYLNAADFHQADRKVRRAVVRMTNGSRDLVMPGDWIIRDADGEFSVCKPDLFEATYEPVPSSAMPWIETHRKGEPK